MSCIKVIFIARAYNCVGLFFGFSKPFQLNYELYWMKLPKCRKCQKLYTDPQLGLLLDDDDLKVNHHISNEYKFQQLLGITYTIT